MNRFTKCPQCGMQLPIDSTFCQYCGAKIEVEDKPPKCPKCGMPLPKGSSFCQYCGAKTETTDSSSTDTDASERLASVDDSESKGRRKQKAVKCGWKPIVLGVLVVVVLVVGYFGYNVLRFENALKNEHFSEANQYFKRIPYGSVIFEERAESSFDRIL